MKALLARLFPENRSACRGGMCAGDPACGDRLCPGHPASEATYLHLREPEPARKPPSIPIVTVTSIAVVLIAVLAAAATVLVP